jgi:hypothetical protein
VPSERCSIEEQSIEYCGWACCVYCSGACTTSLDTTNNLMGILMFKGLTARLLYKLFGVKGLNMLNDQAKSTVSQSFVPSCKHKTDLTPYSRLLLKS